MRKDISIEVEEMGLVLRGVGGKDIYKIFEG